MRVLIVDDDSATRTGLSELLTDAGYEPTAVGSFTEAVDALRTVPFNLLITDVRLDAYNGLQLVINNRSRIPVIVMTGFNDSVLEEQAKREGAVYMLKPVSPHRLLEVVSHLLAGTPPLEVRTDTPE